MLAWDEEDSELVRKQNHNNPNSMGCSQSSYKRDIDTIQTYLRKSENLIQTT